MRAGDQVPERPCTRAEWAVTSMLRVRRLHGHLADRQALPHLHFHDPLESAPPYEPAESARHDDERRTTQLLERLAIQVVVVCVRHEDGVDAARSGCVELDAAA